MVLNSLAALASQYFGLGFLHVVPLGWDHILFVLAVLFFRNTLKNAILQLCAFTLGHATTLALCATGKLVVAPHLVEPAIAASIGCVALHNLSCASAAGLRNALVFGFGLLHGMGFATALHGIGLPHVHFFVALVCFNLGVDAAQISVLFLGYFISQWLSSFRLTSYDLRSGASVALAVIGFGWALLRLCQT